MKSREQQHLEFTSKHIEVVPWLSFLNNQLLSGEDLLIHAVHHLSSVLRLQLLQKVIVHDGFIDQFLSATGKEAMLSCIVHCKKSVLYKVL